MGPPKPKKAEYVLTFNNQIMINDPVPRIDFNSKLHFGLNPFILTKGQEIYYLGFSSVKARREQLRELLVQDFLRENNELRQVDLSFLNTQP